MSQYLPNGDFENKNLDKTDYTDDYNLEQLVEDLLQLTDDNEIGFLIERDLLYPTEFKRKTENFPLCPYQVEATCELFSDYMTFVQQPKYKPAQKLVCHITKTYDALQYVQVLNQHGYESNKNSHHLPLQAK